MLVIVIIGKSFASASLFCPLLTFYDKSIATNALNYKVEQRSTFQNCFSSTRARETTTSTFLQWYGVHESLTASAISLYHVTMDARNLGSAGPN